MRILVVCQYYWPETWPSTDICEGLARRGNEVTVLTGLPNYPEGTIHKGYLSPKVWHQERNGVRIVRAPLVPRKHGAAMRMLNYYSFPAAAEAVLATMKPDYDVVLSIQTSPVMMATPALNYAERHHLPAAVYVVDIWPECLLAGGIRKGSAIYKHFEKVSRRIYDHAPKLLVTSLPFDDYISNLIGRPANAVYLPQFVEEGFGSQTGERPSGFDGEKLHLTFAGNIGKAQAVPTVIEAAELLSHDDRFCFHIVGSGSELETCQHLTESKGLTNVVFHGRRPVEEMPAYYAASDAMLVTFADDEALAGTLPRKVQSYLAAGRPILAAANGEAARVINEAEAGLTCDAEDAEALAGLCRQFADLSSAEREALGEKGRRHYEEFFSEDAFFSKLENELNELGEAHHG